MHIVNPATEELIEEISEDSWQTLNNKWEIVRKGQAAWAATPLEKRIQAIARFQSLLEEEKDELARTLTLEMGKPLQQSYNELKGAIGRVQYFIEHSATWLSEEWTVVEGATREKIVYEPLGVIANISAWNYPYLVGTNVFIPALIGGNSVFYKPSEYSTLTGLHIARMLYQAGIPENCFQLALGRSGVGEHLLDLPLDGYFFTGSYKTGLYIAGKLAPKLVPCQLELGGKDPLYIMNDVENIEKAAVAALEGVVYNNGQSCCAVERIYVQEDIFDSFVHCFVQQAKKLRVGNPMDPNTNIGPLSRKAQVDFLLSHITEAVSMGATLLTGGKAMSGKGYFLEPTVLVDVNHQMKLMKNESFGPLIGIQKVNNDQQAVDLMRDTEYGLTAAVFSRSFERAESVMKQMNTGTVYWNCCDRVSPSLPWSGRKHSGLGTTLSYQGIRSFVQPKAWHIRSVVG